MLGGLLETSPRRETEAFGQLATSRCDQNISLPMRSKTVQRSDVPAEWGTIILGDTNPMDATLFAEERALRKALRTVFFDKIHDSLAIRAYQLRRSQFCVSYPLWDVFVQNPARMCWQTFPNVNVLCKT